MQEQKDVSKKTDEKILISKTYQLEGEIKPTYGDDHSDRLVRTESDYKLIHELGVEDKDIADEYINLVIDNTKITKIGYLVSYYITNTKVIGIGHTRPELDFQSIIHHFAQASFERLYSKLPSIKIIQKEPIKFRVKLKDEKTFTIEYYRQGVTIH